MVVRKRLWRAEAHSASMRRSRKASKRSLLLLMCACSPAAVTV
jgi:hypothetical protein